MKPVNKKPQEISDNFDGIWDTSKTEEKYLFSMISHLI